MQFFRENGGVILRPVIERELRVTARQWFTYTLRIMGTAAAVAVCAVATLRSSSTEGAGARVFGYVHFTQFCAIWILVPLLTADCLSRERREGTLPLLFLTPLKPGSVILAKGIAHGLRAFTLWLAVLPVMTIPFLLGGVGWKEGLISVGVNFSSILLALVVGLLASSLCTSWRRSIVLAFLLGVLAAAIFAVVHGAAVMSAINPYLPRKWFWLQSVRIAADTAIQMAGNFHGIWSEGMTVLPKAARVIWLVTELGLVICASLAGGLMIRFAAWRVQRGWREEGRSERIKRMERVLSRPVFGHTLLRNWLDTWLTRNPVRWLDHRTLSGRLVIWGWLGAVTIICAVGSAFEPVYVRFDRIQLLVAWLLLGSLAAAAAGSFRRERESGFLELMLVAPLGEWQIIAGRLRALWFQFAPALAVFLAFCAWLPGLADLQERIGFLPYLGMVYLTLPVIGLYFAFVCKSFLASFMWTLLLGAVAPLFVFRFTGSLDSVLNLAGAIGDFTPTEIPRFGLSLLIQSTFAAIFALELHRILLNRKFLPK